MPNRQHFLRATAGATAFGSIAYLRYPASAAEYSFKLGLNFNDTHPSTLRAKEMAANVRRDSNGQIAIEVFPNNTLGADPEMLRQVRSGAIQMYLAPGGILASIVPATSITYVGYAFNNYKEVWAAMDGDLGSWCRAAIERAGLNVLPAIWNNGFNSVGSSTHPIRMPADFRGFKIRTSASPIFVATFKSLGAIPTVIDFSEAYNALQTHIVDGVTDPPVAFYTERFYEVQKYMSLTSQMWGGFWLMVNAATWTQLPKNLQDVLERNGDAAARLQRADVEKLEAAVPAKLQSLGMTVNTPKPEAFRAKLRESGFYAQWRRTFGDAGWKALTKYSNAIG